MTLAAEHRLSPRGRLRVGVLPRGAGAQPGRVTAQRRVQPDSFGLPPVGNGGGTCGLDRRMWTFFAATTPAFTQN